MPEIDRLLQHAQTVVDSAMPGYALAERRALDQLARTSPAVLTWLSPTERRQVASALILARARTGDVHDAVELAEAEVRRGSSADSAVPALTISAFWASASEAYVTAGWPRLGTQYAIRAAEYADDDEAALYRALGLECVSRALNGEYDRAIVSSRRARGIEERQEWPATARAYPLFLGEILIASARLDGDALGALAQEAMDAHGDDPVWRTTANSASAMALLARNDTARAIGLITTVTNGVDERGILTMIRGFAIGVHADLLLAQGEARRTLALLQGAQSPTGHALCFDMQRSAALLLLDENREVLSITQPCVRLGHEHCLRTIPPILFRRAIANERLGHHHAADRAFEEAFHHILTSGSATPLLTLPTDELEVLLDRLNDRQPQLDADIAGIRRLLDLVPPIDNPHPALPPLTGREKTIAHHLRSSETVAQLAERLHVSPNTLKSQIRNLYLKLGATSREIAVTLLERAGFYA